MSDEPWKFFNNIVALDRWQGIIWTKTGIFFNKFQWNMNQNTPFWFYIWKCCLQNGSHFVSALMC